MLFHRTLIEDEMPPVGNEPVAHYTQIGTLCHFLLDANGWGSAWATPVQFLNDRLELLLGLTLLYEVANKPLMASLTVRYIIDQLRSAAGSLETDAFQMSFSGSPDDLGQWRGYTANGMGCSVVTRADEVKAAADVAGWVFYEEKKQKAFARRILNKLRRETDSRRITQVLVTAASFMKHRGFQQEQEFRLLVFPDTTDVQFRASGQRLVPYVDYLWQKPPAPKPSLPVDKIIVGPGWQLSALDSTALARNPVVQGIARLLEARGLNATGIESSTIPYDPK